MEKIKETSSQMAYVAVVVIVAVVALVVLLLNWNNNSVDDADVVDEDGNVVGGAIWRGGRFNIDINKLKLAPSRCLWDDYGSCQLIANLLEGETVLLEEEAVNLEGEVVNNGRRYKVENIEVNQAGGVTSVVLDVNGFRARLSGGASERLPDGNHVTAIEVLHQDYAGGINSARVCIK